MTKHRIYTTSVASVYPYYVAKAEKKGRQKTDVNEIIRRVSKRKSYGEEIAETINSL